MIDRCEFKKKRIELCISQGELAKLAGLSYWTIVQFEKGRRIRESSMRKIVGAMRTIEKSVSKNENVWWMSHKDNLLKNL